MTKNWCTLFLARHVSTDPRINVRVEMEKNERIKGVEVSTTMSSEDDTQLQKSTFSTDAERNNLLSTSRQ